MRNDPNTPPDDTLIDRYLAGSLSAGERERVDAFRTANPQYSKALDLLRATATRDDLHPPLSGAETLPVLLARLDEAAPIQRRPGTSWRRWSAYGASAALAVAVIAIAITGRTSRKSASEPTKTYTTGTGERATLNLADGSQVILGPRTTLTVPLNIGVNARSARTLSLVGEAQFNVTPNTTAPFTVRTGAIETRVLGTQFIVQRYPDDVAAVVQVKSGRVSTGPHDRPVLLNAGMRAQLTDSAAIAVESHPTSNSASWVDGRLEFVDAPVPVMLATLTRWYGYRFRLDDSTIAKRHVTITFNVDDRAETMYLLRKVLQGVNMTFQDSTVILRRGPVDRPKRSSKLLDEERMISARSEVGR